MTHFNCDGGIPNISKSKFTEEQEQFICNRIGEWYLIWKTKLVDYEDRTHSLGYAKEQLKMMICGDKIYD